MALRSLKSICHFDPWLLRSFLRSGLDCSLLGAIVLHYAHLRLGLGSGLGLGLGLVLGLGVGLVLVFSETNFTVTVYFNGAQ